MELKQKGTKADIGAFKQINVSLVWNAAVDLDLMAFYRTRDGRTGGIYSDNYQGGSLGALDAFPYIQLSGDAGVGGVGKADRVAHQRRPTAGQRLGDGDAEGFESARLHEHVRLAQRREFVTAVQRAD